MLGSLRFQTNKEKSVFVAGCMYPASLNLKRAKEKQIAPTTPLRESHIVSNLKRRWL